MQLRTVETRMTAENETDETAVITLDSHLALLAAQRKLAIRLLVLSLLVVIACAAVLAALYAPQHMPTAIADIVKNLGPVAHDAILGLAYGLGALGLLSVAQTSQAIHYKKPVSDFSYLSVFACKKNNETIRETNAVSNINTTDTDENGVQDDANRVRTNSNGM